MVIEKIIEEMKEVFKEIPFGIDHTMKVLKNAEDIMKGENIQEEEKELIRIVAILHDIGAVEAQKKYGSIDGVYQEKEGPAVARKILENVGYNKNIDRICFIIGNHHTPSKIDGIDFQIQWEADLLENMTVMDKEKQQQEIRKCIEENFKTKTGKEIAYNRFILEYM
nr:MAG TPA: HDc [Bacteriophage sp.]